MLPNVRWPELVILLIVICAIALIAAIIRRL